MRSKLLACLVALIGISGVAAPPLSACGDKFLTLGRNMSFHQAYASVYPGTIAIYTSNPVGAAESMKNLRKILSRAGHSVQFVGGDLGALVNTSGVDLVLASETESGAVRALIGTAQVQPTVLYVASGARIVARPGVAPVTAVLKPNDKGDTFIKHIENAMKTRAKAGIRVRP